LLACNVSLAQSATPNQPAAAEAGQNQNDASQFVQTLGDQAIAIMSDKSLSSAQRSQKYSGILHDAFDMQAIAHFAVGRAWNAASPDQQQEYLKLFEALVLKNYGDKLSFYSGQGFHVKGVRQENEKESIVSSEVIQNNGGQPTHIDWRVRPQNGKLLIIDVVIDGISQSITQRQEYTAIIQRDGGKMDGLIEQMRQSLKQQPGQS
jgi:phospholipid transport system substrate-binding protein